MLWGPLTRLGLAVAIATAAVDQAVKLWLIFGFDLGARGIVSVTPFLDLVLTWNTGAQRLEGYGAFAHLGSADVLGRVDQLLAAGRLRSTGGRFPKLRLA